MITNYHHLPWLRESFNRSLLLSLLAALTTLSSIEGRAASNITSKMMLNSLIEQLNQEDIHVISLPDKEGFHFYHKNGSIFFIVGKQKDNAFSTCLWSLYHHNLSATKKEGLYPSPYNHSKPQERAVIAPLFLCKNFHEEVLTDKRAQPRNIVFPSITLSKSVCIRAPNHTISLSYTHFTQQNS